MLTLGAARICLCHSPLSIERNECLLSRHGEQILKHVFIMHERERESSTVIVIESHKYRYTHTAEALEQWRKNNNDGQIVVLLPVADSIS